MKSATAQDDDLQMLSKIVKNGWPFHGGQLPVSVGHYFVVRFMNNNNNNNTFIRLVNTLIKFKKNKITFRFVLS